MTALAFALVLAGPHGRATATRVLVPPRIDGKLDDAVWQTAPVLSGFVQRIPDEGKPASEPTEVRIVYDDRAIYVAFRCYDSQAAEIRPRLGRRDDAPESDWVGFAVDPFHDRRNAYMFLVNSAGVKTDGNLAEGANEDYSWDGIWEARTSIDAAGWSAEIEIPLATLRFPRASVQTWGFHVRRYISRKKEQDDWHLIRWTDNGFASRFADLDGLEGVRPGLSLQLLPYVASTLRASYATGNLAPRDSMRAQVGLDVKYGVSGTLTLDATINPDFGQVEVDPEVVNLSAYEVQFPEKRPFFLEGADIFNSPLVYTRRVGAPPPAPDPQHDGDIVQLDPNARILGAAKVTGNLRPGTAIGLLEAYVDGTEAIERVGNGFLSPTYRLQATPPTLFQVARLRQVVGGTSSVGLIETTVARGGHEPDAHVFGADFDLRSPHSDWTANGGAAWSATAACDRARTPDFHGACDALGAQVTAGKTGGEWRALLQETYFGSEFDINDLGYLQKKVGNQYFSNQPHIGVNRGRPFGPFKQLWLDLAWQTAWDPNAAAPGQDIPLIDNKITVDTGVLLRNNWRLGAFYLHELTPFYDDVETRQNPMVRLYRRPGLDGLFTMVRSNDSRPFWVQLSDWFDVENGTWTINPSMDTNLLVGGRVRLGARAAWLQWFGRRRWIDTGDDGYPLFGTLRLRQLELTLRSTLSFSRDLTLQVFSQFLRSAQQYPYIWEQTSPATAMPCFAGTACPDAVAPGAYDTDLTSLIVNAVLRWEFRPGSTLYVVYTHNHQVEGTAGQLALGRSWDALTGSPADNLLAIKLSYLWAL